MEPLEITAPLSSGELMLAKHAVLFTLLDGHEHWTFKAAGRVADRREREISHQQRRFGALGRARRRRTRFSGRGSCLLRQLS